MFFVCNITHFFFQNVGYCEYIDLCFDKSCSLVLFGTAPLAAKYDATFELAYLFVFLGLLALPHRFRIDLDAAVFLDPLLTVLRRRAQRRRATCRQNRELMVCLLLQPLGEPPSLSSSQEGSKQGCIKS